jgi:hypothetical protein
MQNNLLFFGISEGNRYLPDIRAMYADYASTRKQTNPQFRKIRSTVIARTYPECCV